MVQDFCLVVTAAAVGYFALGLIYAALTPTPFDFYASTNGAEPTALGKIYGIWVYLAAWLPLVLTRRQLTREARRRAHAAFRFATGQVGAESAVYCPRCEEEFTGLVEDDPKAGGVGVDCPACGERYMFNDDENEFRSVFSGVLGCNCNGCRQMRDQRKSDD